MKRVALTYRNQKKIAPYAEALRGSGIEPVFVTPEQSVQTLAALAGLVLSGGTDVDPELYGGRERHVLADQPDRERDALEQRLLREALAVDLPVLAICRGMQLFNVTHSGGTLVQHMEGHKLTNNATHDIEIYAGTLLARIFFGKGGFGQGEEAGTLSVNSRHHQAVAQPGRGLIVSAKATGGIVEALERPDLRFAVAVQWHPEDQMPAHQRLFEAFRDSL
jgi:putative glutamine amidotransferase